MSLPNSDGFISSFPFGMLFVIFNLALLLQLALPILCWITVVKIGVLVLFLILEGNPLSFSTLSIMLAVCLSYMASIPTLMRVFNHR